MGGDRARRSGMNSRRLGRVRATAFAKLTLSLRMLGRRQDGFHEIEALTAPIGQPHDTIEAAAVPNPPGVSLDVTGDHGVPTGRDNLALRGAEALLLHAGRAGHGVHLTLRKRIPPARGLGGGSADAAAAMLAVHRLLDVGTSQADMLDLAARLGSDVPFFLVGGAVWMRGRGEEIETVSLRPGIPMLVAMPPFSLATGDVYRAWDELGGPRSRRSVPAPAPIDAITSTLVNDLEPAAEQVEPRLRAFRERLEKAAGGDGLLAGSGSSYVVLADSPRGLPDRAQEVGKELGAPVVAAATVSRAVRVEA
jgi:4-diphosphocytidyl-2-C-methyl-D-erythritol kinase